jgi:hypothetical protein
VLLESINRFKTLNKEYIAVLPVNFNWSWITLFSSAKVLECKSFINSTFISGSYIKINLNAIKNSFFMFMKIK